MVMDLNNKKKYNNDSFTIVVICKELDKLTNNIYDFIGKYDLVIRKIITKEFFYQYCCNVVYDMSKKEMDIDKRISIYEKIFFKLKNRIYSGFI